MRKLWSVLLILLLLLPLVFADDVNTREKELSEIRKKLEENRKNLEKSKKTKSTKEKNVKDYKSKLSSNLKLLKKIQKEQNKIGSKLRTTKQRIYNTNQKIGKQQNLYRQEFTKLFYIDQRKKIDNKRNVDNYLILHLMKQTHNEILGTQKEKNSLAAMKSEQERLVNRADKKAKETRNRQYRYEKKIGSLKKELTKLEKDEIKYAKLIDQLEANARELESLIAKLKLDEMDSDYSFKFSSARLKWPYRGKVIRGYGTYSDPRYKTKFKSNGIDIKASIGQSVKSVDSGVVVFAEWFGSSGKVVIIDHKNGFHTLYSHNSKILVSKGDEVQKNQEIALTGDTGNVDQPSLHFEIRKKGKPVDPMLYLEK